MRVEMTVRLIKFKDRESGAYRGPVPDETGVQVVCVKVRMTMCGVEFPWWRRKVHALNPGLADAPKLKVAFT